MQRIRGGEIALILQEPMTSLNPVLNIGDQVAELYKHHPEKALRGHGLMDAAADILQRVRIPDAARRLSEFPMIPSPANPPSGCHYHPRCPIAVEQSSTSVPAWREINSGRWVACRLAAPEGAAAPAPTGR